MLKNVLLAVIIAAFSTACAMRDANLIAAHHGAAQTLAKRAGLALDKNRPVLVAPFLEVNRLDEYTDFGSMAGEHMGSRLAQLGYTVLEVKLNRDALYTLDGKGGLLLSDELKNLSDSVDAQAVLMGTYAPGRHHVYLSARLVRAKDNVLLASEDYRLPLGPDTEVLLKGEDFNVGVTQRSQSWY